MCENLDESGLPSNSAKSASEPRVDKYRVGGSFTVPSDVEQPYSKTNAHRQNTRKRLYRGETGNFISKKTHPLPVDASLKLFNDFLRVLVQHKLVPGQNITLQYGERGSVTHYQQQAVFAGQQLEFWAIGIQVR